MYLHLIQFSTTTYVIPAPADLHSRYAATSAPTVSSPTRSLQTTEGPARGTSSQIGVKRLSCRWASAPFAKPFPPADPSVSIERKSDYIANASRMAGNSHAPAIYPHEPRRSEGSGSGPGPYHT